MWLSSRKDAVEGGLLRGSIDDSRSSPAGIDYQSDPLLPKILLLRVSII